MSWEQRNHDFSTAQVDAQVAYIEAEREVKRLQDENAKLRELVRDLYDHAEFSIHYFGDIYGICDRMRELEVEV